MSKGALYPWFKLHLGLARLVVDSNVVDWLTLETYFKVYIIYKHDPIGSMVREAKEVL
jgi:hypothetical protein